MGQIEQIKQELKAAAQSHDLCGAWQQMLDHAGDKATLVQMYMRGIDFCFGWDFPSVSYLRRHFKGQCETYGLHIDEKFEAHNIRKAALVGTCAAQLQYDQYEVAQLFVKHTSQADIEARGHSILTIDCFDDSRLNIRASEGAQVNIYRYGNAQVNYTAQPGSQVTVTDKHKRGYYD